jgi:dCMP deaminase
MSLIEFVKAVKYRPCWDEYFMSVAFLISKRSSCDRLHVGCVIVNDKRIITTGYNGHIKGTPHTSFVRDGHEQMTIHAETNAITDAAARGIKLYGSTAYVTHYPCINCAKNLIASGISEIIYAEDYKNDSLCDQLYVSAKVKITKYEQKIESSTVN